MTLMLDQDSTQAADLTEDETQSLHAWSQADDADTVIAYTPGHSWKVPALLAALAAVAAVVAGAFLMWPHSATKPQVAPVKPQVAAPVQPTPKLLTKDEQFVRLLQEHSISTGPVDVVASEGRGICRRIDGGETEQQMARDVMAGTPGISEKDAYIWVDTAIDVYCPR